MAKTINPILKLYDAQFNDKEFSSANHLSNALLTESEWLAPMVTHAFGSDANYGSRNFPLSFITEGMGNVKSISSTDGTYKVKILGKPKKTSAIVSHAYTATSKPGAGHSEIEVVFADRQFHKSASVYTPSRLELRIVADGVQVANGWKYRFKLMNPSATAFVPLSDLAVGTLWARGIAKVGLERSRGVESRSYTPYTAMNQLSLVRDTYKLAGNIKNKVMVLEIRANGQTFKFWTQWELFLRQLEWKEKCESDLWYSTYNRDENGVIHVYDEDSGEVVPSGAGLLQQIPNEDFYSYLTTQKIETLITDIFFNASDADKVDVEIYTGTGGMREASRAMEAAAKQFQLIDTKVVQGNAPGYLTYGAYFNTYMHRDGHKVVFKHLPMMDRGIMADVSPLHPNDNLPIESYNMYCVDNSTYDGMKNIVYVSEKGREELNFVVAGAMVPPGFNEGQMFRASDIDASSVEWMKSQGIHVMKPTNCFKLFNGLS